MKTVAARKLHGEYMYIKGHVAIIEHVIKMYAAIRKSVSFLFVVVFTGTCLLGYLMVNYSASYYQLVQPLCKPRLYTFAFSYMDQMTWAARRLKSLQCWSSEWKTNYNVRVVEPFVIGGSRLGVPKDINRNKSSYLKFSDVFDINTWNFYWGLSSPYSEMSSWDIFLQYAPRSVVAVQIVYRYNYHCAENTFSEDSCNFTHLNESIREVLEPHNFTVLNRVCINFRILWSLMEEEFHALIFRNVPRGLGVTVVFDEWRGIPSQRGAIDCWIQVDTGGKCSHDGGLITHAISKTLVASSEIENVAKKYISRYLDWKHGYVAVMIRWEKILLYDFFFGENRQHYTGENCTRLIRDYVESVYKNRRLNTTFLSTDTGKYGSATFNLYNSTRDGMANITRYTEDLMWTLHRNQSMSLAEYENRFEEISGMTNPAFISQLQKTIAVGARCLLLVGGGTFHQNILKLYKQMHVYKACYAIIDKC